MKGKMSRSLFSLILAVCFMLQGVYVTAFADDELLAEEQQDEQEVSFAVDSDGEYVELGDDFDYETESQGGFEVADTDAFFDYSGDVSLFDTDTTKGTLAVSANFQSASVGATEVEGWSLACTPANPSSAKTSTIQVVSDSEKGNVLELSKKTNGNTNEKYTAGDERVSAEFPITDVSGKMVIVAEVKMTQPGRLGMYTYSSINEVTGLPIYNGRLYSWDNGASGTSPVDPAKTSPTKYIAYDGSSKAESDSHSKSQVKDAKMSTNKWYTWMFDMDYDNGTYDVYVDGTCLYKGLTLDKYDSGFGGVGFEIQNDKKSLGTLLVGNFAVYDMNEAAQNDEFANADAAALQLGINANEVTEGFTVPTSGQYHNSTITWESSNTAIASVNNNTGFVTINRPVYSGAGKVNVNLTATVTLGGSTVKKIFTITVYEMSPEADKDKVQVDADGLSLPASAQGNVTEGFEVTTIGAACGSAITWESSHPDIVSVDNATGKVTITRPPFDGNGVTTVTLTAKVKSGSATVEKTFSVTVLQLDPATDKEKAQYAANTLIIGGIDENNIKLSSFYLADTGLYDSSISWVSSNEEYITIDNNYDEDPETGNVTRIDGYIAKVTRPDRDKNPVVVNLTATVNVNGETAEKTFSLIVQPEDQIKAYPGVEGYGAYSVGGRGGAVYHVTNLNEKGEGSLAYGIEELKGPRTIVFDVAGVIDMSKRSEGLKFKGEKGSNITVAGQTAPFPGIEIKGRGITLSNVHDVVIRHLRLRIGGTKPDGDVYQEDPMSIGNSHDVVVDHCTMQWSIDMCFRVTGNDVTLSNNIFDKPLTDNTPHEKGEHPYVGMINEGASKVSFLKNFIGDSTQRSPRITDADWIDAYNNLLYHCSAGFDIYNYEWQDKNSKMNVYNNFARKGPRFSNDKPYRSGRGRTYAGGVMVYFDGNYGRGSSDGAQTTTTIEKSTLKRSLYFGETNSKEGEAYDLSNVTLDEWDNNPLSYDNGGKQTSAATLTYMNYPFPAPRGYVLPGDKSSIMGYAENKSGDGQSMGATKPARDVYDQMVIAEALVGDKGENSTAVSLSQDAMDKYFSKLEDRTGLDYSKFKTERNWTMRPYGGEGPVLKTNPLTGKSVTHENPYPINWDNYLDVNTQTNATASKQYSFTTDFEIGSSWWGEFTGYPGVETVYSFSDGTRLVEYSDSQLAVMAENEYAKAVGRGDVESSEEAKAAYIAEYWKKFNETFGTKISDDGTFDANNDTGFKAADKSYIPVYRTVADLYPDSYYDNFRNDYPGEAAAMENYRLRNYANKAKNYQIVWDSMGDGIPDWYKEYKGWPTNQALNKTVDPETGYTYLELYLAFAAGDKELATDDTPASIENFRYNKLGYSSVQLFWNTDYRTSCVIEYGTEPGKYTNSIPLEYTSATNYYHTYHDVTLVGLEPDTNYYYKVTAVDELSNVTVAEYNPNDENEKAMTFKTTVAPEGAEGLVPSKPIVTNTVPYLNQVRLNWEGDVATDSGYEIYYDTESHNGVIGDYPNSVTGLSGQTFKQVITGLENYTPYYFVVVATNANGKTASDEVEVVPTGTLYNFDFNKMTQQERETFQKTTYMYDLGGSMQIKPDPDTGEYVLEMFDDTNSHGVNTKWSFPVTQTDKLTTTVKFKILYQKQTDTLNHQKDVLKVASPEHNTFQFNYYMDANINDDLDSTNSGLWDSVFNVYFDATTTPITMTPDNRMDGTIDSGNITFSNKQIGTYTPGRTVPNTEDVAFFDGKTYPSTSAYKDAKYIPQESNDADTLEAAWYYEKGSAKYMTLKVVADMEQNNVKVYLDDQLLYAQGEFNEDLEEPYNIGRFEIKSRNDGYAWVDVASISIVGGDGEDVKYDENGNVIKPNVVPADKGGGTGGGAGGGGGGGVTPPSQSSEPTTSADPNASNAPTTAPDVNSADDFTDLGGSEWAKDAIDALVKDGIVQGTGDGKFEPNREVTRAEYISMLMRTIPDMEVDTSSVSGFSDVNGGDWYHDTIYRAAALGIVNGIGDGSFGVNEPISREDMMVMASRFMDATGAQAEPIREMDTFTDSAEVSDYAAQAIEKMYCAGIINGMGDGKLEPKGVANRAQAAKIIYEIMGGNNDEK